MRAYLRQVKTCFNPMTERRTRRMHGLKSMLKPPGFVSDMMTWSEAYPWAKQTTQNRSKKAL